VPQLSKVDYARYKENEKITVFLHSQRSLRPTMTHSGANVFGFISEVNDLGSNLNENPLQTKKYKGQKGIESTMMKDTIKRQKRCKIPSKRPI